MSTELLRILAFDTSSQITSVAVCQGGRVLAEDHAQTEERHAEVLLPKLQQCLAQAGLATSDIDVIGVGVGPGSFTGVRVGVATAKGLGLALHKPVIPVVSLEALGVGAAALLPDASFAWIAPCVDAHKGEVFAALYRRDAGGLTPRLTPFHAAPRLALEQLAAVSGDEPVALVGPGVARYPELRETAPAAIQYVDAPGLSAPPARAVAALALRAAQEGLVPALASVLPLYLRDSDAQLPKQPLRL